MRSFNHGQTGNWSGTATLKLMSYTYDPSAELHPSALPTCGTMNNDSVQSLQQITQACNDNFEAFTAAP
eukprot:scaffold98800_cov21-Tisochrysis_lutea.AAC.1